MGNNGNKAPGLADAVQFICHGPATWRQTLIQERVQAINSRLQVVPLNRVVAVGDGEQ